MGPGVVQPENFPIRDPRDPLQVHGRIVNQVRYPEMGGMNGSDKWTGKPSIEEKNTRENDFRVESPTKVRAAKKSSDHDVM
jgi:hypothetical protein